MVSKKLTIILAIILPLIAFSYLFQNQILNLKISNKKILTPDAANNLTYSDLINLELEYRLNLFGFNNNFTAIQDSILNKLAKQTPDQYLNKTENLAKIPIAIEIFLKMNQRTNNPFYLEYAKRYGDFLLTLQNESGEVTWQCFTTGGWVTPGLISAFIELFKITGNEKYLAAAENGGQYLLKSKVNEGWNEGSCSKNISLNFWTTQGSIYALLKLYDTTNNKIYLDQIIKSSDYLITLQNKDGGWSQHYDSKNDSSIDGISYINFSTTPGAMIALYQTYQLTGNTKYLQAGLKGADWLTTSQDETGGWFAAYRNNIPTETEENYWWDHSTIAAIDALLVTHVVKNSPSKFQWFPAWPEDEIFVEAFKHSLIESQANSYLKAAAKGRDKLIKALEQSSNSDLEIYSIRTILLTMEDLELN